MRSRRRGDSEYADHLESSEHTDRCPVTYDLAFFFFFFFLNFSLIKIKLTRSGKFPACSICTVGRNSHIWFIDASVSSHFVLRVGSFWGRTFRFSSLARCRLYCRVISRRHRVQGQILRPCSPSAQAAPLGARPRAPPGGPSRLRAPFCGTVQGAGAAEPGRGVDEAPACPFPVPGRTAPRSLDRAPWERLLASLPGGQLVF